MRCKPKQSVSRWLCQPLPRGKSTPGFTLVEVVISVAIVAVVFGGIITSYIQSGLRLQWAGYSLAAQSLVVHTVEQVKSTVWDSAQTTPVNQLYQMKLLGISSNSVSCSGYSTNILDIPYSSTNFIMAT